MTRISYDPRQANKGMDLEAMIERAIEHYNQNKVALLQKIPTPIRPVKVDYKKGVIYKAFFEKKSTVDYIGNYKGYMLAFDAKENSIETRFPLSNVEEHQYSYLRRNKENGGISFLIVSFTTQGEIYYLPFRVLDRYWKGREKGGRKSIPYDEFEHEIEPRGLIRVDFIEVVKGVINNA